MNKAVEAWKNGYIIPYNSTDGDMSRQMSKNGDALCREVERLEAENKRLREDLARAKDCNCRKSLVDYD